MTGIGAASGIIGLITGIGAAAGTIGDIDGIGAAVGITGEITGIGAAAGIVKGGLGGTIVPTKSPPITPVITFSSSRLRSRQ
jgi:hypothetical protein